jgi:hypothetical protein
MRSDLPTSTYFTGMFRIGRVSSVDAKAHTAQVQFFEIDGFVSWDLQVLTPLSGDYAMPTKDTPVLCVILEGRLGVGFVLGAIYTENDKPPLDDAGKRSIAGDDLRLGAPDASDKVALAPKCKDNDTALWDVLNNVCGASAPVVNEAGNGGPSSLQVAFKAAIAAQQAANKLPPVDPAAENVSAK